MRLHTVTIVIVLSLLSLCACTATPPKPSQRVLALTEPAKGTTKKIEELRSEGDEQQFIVEANATMAKDRQDKLRLREYLMRETGSWLARIKKRLWGGGPAGGGR
jgi:hypothetical protein